MNRIKTFLKENNCFISFIVGSLCMYMVLSYAGVLRTGKYCILEGDLFEIYVPIIRNFCRNILNGQSIYYSWNNSLGMNTSAMLSFCCAYNPLNILYLIFYKIDPNIITAATVVIKAGLSALTFQLYEKKVLKVDGFGSVIFSILYALCSFQVAYGIVNIIWSDALYVLPVVFISLYILQNKGNPIPLALSYAYIFIVQPYMGFVIGLFSFIYFSISIFLNEKKISSLRYVLGFILSVLIAIFISAFAWFPALYQLIDSGIHSSKGFASLGINPLDVYNQLFFGNNNSIVECMPNIYCGILTLLLLPLFFIDKNNDKKIKIRAGLLLLVLLLSCVILPFYKVWCVFDKPDGWPFRFSFCLSFIIVSLASIEFKNIRDINSKMLYIIAGADLFIYILEIFLLRRPNIVYPINNYMFFFINLIILAIWVGAILLYKKNIDDDKKMKGVSLLVVILVCFEVIGNGFSSYYKGDNYYTVPETNETHFNSWYANQKQLIDYLNDDDSFYRVNYMGDYLYNSDTFSGYNGLSDFSTFENIHVRNALRNMGFATSRKVSRNFGITPVTKMLLAVKYDADGFLPFIGSDSYPSLEISDNPYALSLGYMVNDKILDFSFTSTNSFENLNSLISCMTNENVVVFKDIDKNIVYLEDDGLRLEKKDNGYAFVNETGEYSSFISFVPDPDIQNDDLYIYFDNYESGLFGDSMYADDGFENRYENGGVISRSYIKPFEKYMDDSTIIKEIIVIANGLQEQAIKDYYIASFDEEPFYDAYEKLSVEQLKILKISNTLIEGNIEVSNDGEVLFTTIPFDKGWEARVDGNYTEVKKLLDGAFVGIEVPKGKHEIVFRYHVLGLKEGIVLSSVGILLFAMVFAFYRFSQKNKNE